jgi:hypothetical protein
MQRVLTHEEIAQLAKDYEALARWEQVRQFVYALYGNAAYRVKVETTLPYNDEYFQDAEIERIVVYDRQGKEMEPDLTLPFWQQEIYVEKIEQAIRDEELEEVFEEIMEEVQQQLPRFSDLDSIPASFYHNGPEEMIDRYTFDAPPTISFPVVYVDER